ATPPGPDGARPPAPPPARTEQEVSRPTSFLCRTTVERGDGVSRLRSCAAGLAVVRSTIHNASRVPELSAAERPPGRGTGAAARAVSTRAPCGFGRPRCGG